MSGSSSSHLDGVDNVLSSQSDDRETDKMHRKGKEGVNGALVLFPPERLTSRGVAGSSPQQNHPPVSFRECENVVTLHGT